jgi:aspartyl-tRNA(Asn)/glutamyl-tRNA(Gln) amidotransferase subunit A
MHNLSLKALSNALKTKKVSVSEVSDHFLNRIKRHDPALNSFITVTDHVAKEQVSYAQKAIEAGGSLLAGVPISYKDIFCTNGIKTSCASKMLDNFIAPYDATLVEKAKQAGMVMLGKNNMDEFAFGSSNETSLYGATNNPWDLNRVPGGSSGGSAAAVAARLIPAALGTDTGGSVRQPAAFCGISALKPTYGTLSRFGMIAFASSLDQAGPMAKTAEDLALMMNVLSGFDEKDSTSAQREHPDFTKDLNKSLEGMKIGLPKECFTDALDNRIAKNIHDTAAALQKKGAKLIDISLPHLPLSVPCYYIIATAEASSNLSRYDGIRYGYRAENPNNLDELYTKTRSEGFGKEVKRRVMVGTYVLSKGYYDAYYTKAQKIRRLIRQDFINAFNQVDVILGPTTPTTAFKKGEHSKNPIELYLSDVYTTAVNLAGLPALSMPSGFIDNLPCGSQLIGPHFKESRLLNVAHQFQLDTDFHTIIPTGFME